MDRNSAAIPDSENGPSKVPTPPGESGVRSKPTRLLRSDDGSDTMIFVVSGLPRSGTSLAMQMLAAGGVPILTDGVRASDPDNPRGYYEWERIKQLPHEPGLIAEAEGKAVKVISSLLFVLPGEYEYRLIFMLRAIEEVLASQAAMIRNRGTQAPAVPAQAMIAALKAHLAQVNAGIASRQSGGRFQVLKVNYQDLVANPRSLALSMAEFLHLPLDIDAMASQVDPTLYRQRLARG